MPGRFVAEGLVRSWHVSRGDAPAEALRSRTRAAAGQQTELGAQLRSLLLLVTLETQSGRLRGLRALPATHGARWRPFFVHSFVTHHHQRDF